MGSITIRKREYLFRSRPTGSDMDVLANWTGCGGDKNDTKESMELVGSNILFENNTALTRYAIISNKVAQF